MLYTLLTRRYQAIHGRGPHGMWATTIGLRMLTDQSHSYDGTHDQHYHTIYPRLLIPPAHSTPLPRPGDQQVVRLQLSSTPCKGCGAHGPACACGKSIFVLPFAGPTPLLNTCKLFTSPSMAIKLHPRLPAQPSIHQAARERTGQVHKLLAGLGSPAQPNRSGSPKQVL